MNDLHNLIYAFFDDVSGHVMQYYICPDPVWAERTFKTLLSQITCGEPREFSFRLVGALDELGMIWMDELILDAQKNGIELKSHMKGVDYERKVANDV
uniref:Replication initiator protein n=1 Tax=Dulem virus 137 TaxID=3145614 RepID=A0AAU8AZH3_9VIRU